MPRAQLNVTVVVVDENDQRPTFVERSYSVVVNESARVGTELVRVRAEDRDEGENARITYQYAPTLYNQ